MNIVLQLVDQLNLSSFLMLSFRLFLFCLFRYGQTATINQVFEMLNSTITTQSVNVAMLGGIPGSGKSLVAKTILQTAIQKQCTVASSKVTNAHRLAINMRVSTTHKRSCWLWFMLFEQLDQLQNTPLACFKQIIDELLMRILTKETSEVQRWKEKFMNILSTNAALMANIFPFLEHIIGKQPQEADVPPAEARAR